MDDGKSFDGMLAPPLRQSHSINRFHGARLTYG
jgi:hypothetical protein